MKYKLNSIFADQRRKLSLVPFTDLDIESVFFYEWKTEEGRAYYNSEKIRRVIQYLINNAYIVFIDSKAYVDFNKTTKGTVRTELKLSSYEEFCSELQEILGKHQGILSFRNAWIETNANMIVSIGYMDLSYVSKFRKYIIQENFSDLL